MDTLIALCAKYLIWVVVLGGLVYVIFEREWKRFSVFALCALALSYALGKLASALWYDPRPFVVGHFTPLVAHAADNGFPSDHTLLGGAISAIVFSYNKVWGSALFVLTLVVGLSRVYAGVHHVADIFGSLVFSIIATWVMSLIWKYFARGHREA